jgi:hypothetical protein
MFLVQLGKKSRIFAFLTYCKKACESLTAILMPQVYELINYAAKIITFFQTLYSWFNNLTNIITLVQLWTKKTW